MFNEIDRKLLALHASRAHSAHQFACVRYVNENYRKEIIFELRHTHRHRQTHDGVASTSTLEATATFVAPLAAPATQLNLEQTRKKNKEYKTKTQLVQTTDDYVSRRRDVHNARRQTKRSQSARRQNEAASPAAAATAAAAAKPAAAASQQHSRTNGSAADEEDTRSARYS